MYQLSKLLKVLKSNKNLISRAYYKSKLTVTRLHHIALGIDLKLVRSFPASA